MVASERPPAITYGAPAAPSAAPLPATKVTAPTVTPAEDAAHISATPSDMHDAQVYTANVIKSSLPKKLDDVTTLTDVRVEGTALVYIYEVTSPAISNEAGISLASTVTKRFCASPNGPKVLKLGGAYGYEYQNQGKVLYRFNITLC
jgi:hypothetical protein